MASNVRVCCLANLRKRIQGPDSRTRVNIWQGTVVTMIQYHHICHDNLLLRLWVPFDLLRSLKHLQPQSGHAIDMPQLNPAEPGTSVRQALTATPESSIHSRWKRTGRIHRFRCASKRRTASLKSSRTAAHASVLSSMTPPCADRIS